MLDIAWVDEIKAFSCGKPIDWSTCEFCISLMLENFKRQSQANLAFWRNYRHFLSRVYDSISIRNFVQTPHKTTLKFCLGLDQIRKVCWYWKRKRDFQKLTWKLQRKLNWVYRLFDRERFIWRIKSFDRLKFVRKTSSIAAKGAESEYRICFVWKLIEEFEGVL